MKKLLLLLFVGIIGIGNAQTTAIPDTNFEQALIDLGLDNVIDGGVLTANIDTATYLNVQYSNISSLTGIEGFTSLEVLICRGNLISDLNISQNLAIKTLLIGGNQLTSVDLFNNTNLTHLSAGLQPLESLNVSNNLLLRIINCSENSLQELDLSNNPALISVDLEYTLLTCLNVANGTNEANQLDLYTTNIPTLSCIEVDDVAYSTAFFSEVGVGQTFSTNCNNSCSSFVGLNETNLSNLSIYPNPSNTGFMQLNTSIVNSDINVYSIEGKQINFTKSNNVIDISENEKGVYLVSIDGVVIRYVYQD